MAYSNPQFYPIQSVYAFVSWIASYALAIILILWIVLPSSTLQHYGITYYPSRYYALAVPAYLIVVYTLCSIIYMAWNMWTTLSPDDIATSRDRDRDHSDAIDPTHDVHSPAEPTMTSSVEADPSKDRVDSKTNSAGKSLNKRRKSTPHCKAVFVRCSLREGIPDFADIDPVALSAAMCFNSGSDRAISRPDFSAAHT